ncbi:hypothetical protein [Pseudonocardia lacus]|uniref:hypothetical protein n=1 Tax=Pseudonocardia lacus TaxID=2835865 RepID=UPI001BDC92C6|nr:hypothetical protein [Pseudonocardia lacus]
MRNPLRRRTATAEPRPPEPADAAAAEELAQARADADGLRWDGFSARRRVAATREAWRWMLAARTAGFRLDPPPPPTPAGYLALPVDIATAETVDPGLLVTCGQCGCVINRLERRAHGRFHALLAGHEQLVAPSA